MMNTLEDLALACCVSLCCLSVFGFFFLSAVLKRAGRGFGDLFDGEGGLFGMDFGNLLDLFTGGRR
jgi:hypothetical protein